MERNNPVYQTYLDILHRELVPAMGCTEPIAIAYCAAVARSVLAAIPEKMTVEASGNIIKNVKSVVVPNTGGLRGIQAAACIGALGGDEHAGLEVISHVSEETKTSLKMYMEHTPVKVQPFVSDELLDLIITVYSGQDQVKVRIAGEHTHIVLIERNGEIILKADPEDAHAAETNEPDYTLLTVERICDFANTCELEDIQPVLDRQIACNTAIAEEGLQKEYGANIGKVLLKTGNDVRTRAKAWAAAGSDARMNGSEKPVVICSGSGNQGLTVSLPVIVYARELHVEQEKLYRALLVSNLITLHAKTGIGRLSAYCGAVSAGAGAGAGIAYLYGGDERDIAHTIVNALAITSGIVCDGAKSSCAAKIAMAVETGIFGYEMFRNGQQFYGGDGLVVKGVENSIAAFGRLARIGMRETDHEIIRMMTESH